MRPLRQWLTRRANGIEGLYRPFERGLFLGQPLSKRGGAHLHRPIALADPGIHKPARPPAPAA